MRKDEREFLQEQINKHSHFVQEAALAFKELQELNATEGTGTRWCNAKRNALDLLACGKDYMYLYEKYIKAEAMQEAIGDLGAGLANLGFWKE